MQFDLENSGTWFDLDGGGRICLRVCAGDDFRNIRSQAVKRKSEVVFDPKTRQPHRLVTDETDDELLSNLLWDFVIVDWQNFFDSKEKPIPCNSEMKRLMMGRVPAFQAIVNRCLKQLQSMEEQASEELEKN